MTQVTIGYGMTETSPLATQTQADDSLDVRVSTVGRAHPHVEIQIADPATGERVPYGTPGEFRTRGYSVMLGYWDPAGADRGGHRRVRLDAHQRPGDDGCRRLRQHHRPDQGHAHSRGREHLPT